MAWPFGHMVCEKGLNRLNFQQSYLGKSIAANACLLMILFGTIALRAQDSQLNLASDQCQNNKEEPHSREEDPSKLKKIANCLRQGNLDCKSAGFDFKGFVLIDVSQGSAGYVVIKDRKGATQLLLVPTRRIPGIEGTCLIAEPSPPNYFADAWKSSTFLSPSRIEPGHPAVSLAVNPKPGRTDGQLHIHIDWVRQKVLDQLITLKFTEQWTILSLQIDDHTYQYKARRTNSLQGDSDPFHLVAEVLGPKRYMRDQTVVVIGLTNGGQPDGFIVLVGEYPAVGEDLQTNDHCDRPVDGVCPPR